MTTKLNKNFISEIVNRVSKLCGLSNYKLKQQINDILNKNLKKKSVEIKDIAHLILKNKNVIDTNLNEASLEEEHKRDELIKQELDKIIKNIETNYKTKISKQIDELRKRKLFITIPSVIAVIIIGMLILKLIVKIIFKKDIRFIDLLFLRFKNIFGELDTKGQKLFVGIGIVLICILAFLIFKRIYKVGKSIIEASDLDKKYNEILKAMEDKYYKEFLSYKVFLKSKIHKVPDDKFKKLEKTYKFRESEPIINYGDLKYDLEFQKTLKKRMEKEPEILKMFPSTGSIPLDYRIFLRKKAEREALKIIDKMVN